MESSMNNELKEQLNPFQSSLEELNLSSKPREIQDQFWDFFYNVPLIQNMVNKDRKRAKDLPRDKSGKIIIDLTHPHILENMDYFRPTAIHFQQTGKFTDLRPNPNPNSEFGKWIREEVRRCHEGMVRPSDGEWIPGDLYFFWNYAPMSLSKKGDKKSRRANRVVDFPNVWDGHYLKFHYLNQARDAGKHALELASRQKGKSFCAASLLAKRFVLGESYEVNKKVTCYATAAEKGYLVKGDQTLDKFQFDIDFLADNTEWPRKRLISTIQNMQWTMGYQDLDSGTKKGTLNSVMGVTSKDDESKLRGTRGVLYIIEEAGSFPRLLDLWGNMLPSVEDGDDVYGILFGYGTAGDNQSDFYAMSEMMYHPEGYHVYGVENVYDILGKGSNKFAFFFPGYMNKANCYDENGNSDVTKALLEILEDRYKMKYNSTDINAVSKRTAEIPIVPQEAIMRTRGNIFPIAEINERILQLDSDPHAFDEVYVGKLVQKNNGQVEFEPTNDLPIRNFPLKDNKAHGALEIYKMPVKNKDGSIPFNRYIASEDPVDSDNAESLSLCSIFVMDLFTDKIVAEYTGRQDRAEENYEILRKLCLFYNAKCLYENNLKGTYAYFSKMRCSYLLADTPDYLRDKDLIKGIGSIGNTSKGVTATKPINDYANKLIRDWLIKPCTIIERDAEGNEVESSVYNLTFLTNRALLKELSLYNPNINVDRIRSLGLLMLYREQFMIQSEGNPTGGEDLANDKSYLGNDDFFQDNYDKKLYFDKRILL